MKLTDLSLSSQWWAIMLAGAGIGFILGPASTDSVNRAIGASYGEATGISNTVRGYASALGLAVLGTLLAHVFTQRVTTSLIATGVPGDKAGVVAGQIGQSAGTGGSGSMPAGLSAAIGHDYAAATQVVFWAMAAAMVICLIVAFAHPGDRVTAPDQSAADPIPALA